jgi:hypothetical protein
VFDIEWKDDMTTVQPQVVIVTKGCEPGVEITMATILKCNMSLLQLYVSSSLLVSAVGTKLVKRYTCRYINGLIVRWA